MTKMFINRRTLNPNWMGANTKIFLILMLFIVLFVSACTQNQQVVCNKPYTLVGNSCCLDKNDNKICDNDETTSGKNEEINCNIPYIKVGNNCCLDKNNNKICDNDEKESAATSKEYKLNFSIDDLQSDINKVLGTPILLVKDVNTDKFQVYSDKTSNSKFLGKYGASTYFKLVTKKPVIVIQINDKSSYLNNYQDFYDFVNNNKNIFIESATKSKEIFENEFKNGELPKIIYLKEKPKQVSDAEKAKYMGHEEISSKIFFDNITFPETVSKRIAQIFYVRVNKYKVNISSVPERVEIKEELSNTNLAYNMIVYCNPNLIISLNEECFGQGIYFCQGTGISHDIGYDSSDVNSDYFLTNLKTYYTPYTAWAQSLIDMCDQKYKLNYVVNTIIQ